MVEDDCPIGKNEVISRSLVPIKSRQLLGVAGTASTQVLYYSSSRVEGSPSIAGRASPRCGPRPGGRRSGRGS